jgi:hypothetical protein
MIKDSLIPNLEHSVAINYGFEGVRAECAKRHGKKAKGRGNPNKYNHFLLLFTEVFHSSEGFNCIVYFLSEWESGRRLPHYKTCRHVRSGLASREESWSAPASGAFSLVPKLSLGMLRLLKLCFIGNDGRHEGKTKTKFRRWIGSETGVWEPGARDFKTVYR